MTRQARCISTLLVLLLVGCKGTSSKSVQAAAKATPTTRAVNVSPSTTDAVPVTSPPTTISTSDQIGQYLKITDPVVGKNIFKHDTLIGVGVANIGPKAIKAYQASITLTIEDALGRSYKQTFRDSCTVAPGVGQSFPAAPAVDDNSFVGDQGITAFLKASADCTWLSYHLNQYISDQASFLAAINGSNSMTSHIVYNRLTFADGESIGTAT